MRRWVTVLVVVVVAAIALAAGFDALRGEPTSEPAAQDEAERPSVSTSPESEAPDPEGELTGTLYFTNESCELQAIELPGRTPTEAPGWDECRFVLSPDGRRVAGAGAGWDPRSDPLIGRLFQSEDGRIQVATNRGPEEEPFAGRAPAWKPDGTLTYFGNRAVRTWPEGDVLLSQDDLARAVRAHPDVPDTGHVRPVSVRELAWLDGEHAVVILDGVISAGPRQSLLAVFDGRRLSAMSGGDESRLADLRVSPQGGFIAVRSDDDLLLLNADGGVLPTPALAGYRALAWSPDEQWLAVASAGGVSLFEPGDSGPPALELDLDANDLAWRGAPGPPMLTDADEAREWLDGLATGRLFVTLSEGSICTLQAIQLPDLQWAERPPGLPSPCRFELDESDEVIAEIAVPQPGGGQVAVCQNNAVDVFNEEGLLVGYPGGCAPAWTPDGRLTFVRNGALVEPERSLLSRRELEDLLGRPSALEEIAWVDDERFWAVARSGAGAILALMTTDRLVFSPTFTSRTIEGLEVSSSGMVAARSDEGVVIFDSGGRRALSFPNGRAVAWEPGELIAAVATPTEILFVAPVSREVVSLPLAVSDLEWVIP